MPNPIVITVPANDEALCDEINEQLAPFAEVREASPTFGLNEVKLVIEIINGSAGIIASTASVRTFLLLLRDRFFGGDSTRRILCLMTHIELFMRPK